MRVEKRKEDGRVMRVEKGDVIADQSNKFKKSTDLGETNMSVLSTTCRSLERNETS
jgi:hypothetical protein